MTEKVDAIVVGLGIVGSSIFERLSRRSNYKVIGIDRYHPPHHLGSSGGPTRMFRGTPGEGPPYDKLALRSYHNLLSFERIAKRPFFNYNSYGGFDAATPLSNRALISREKLWTETVEEICANRRKEDDQFRYQRYIGAEFKAQFPTHNLPDNADVIWQNRIHVMAFQSLWESYLSFGQANGGIFYPNRRVRLDLDYGNAVVLSDNIRIEAEHIFCTAGPWMKELLGDRLPINLTPERRVVAEYESEERFPGGALPGCIVVEINGVLEVFYFVPSLDGRLIKVGKNNHLREIIQPGELPRKVDQQDIDILNDAARTYLRGISANPVSTITCTYTMTENGHFVIDSLPGYPGVHVFSPCNGTGAKYAGVYGEIAGAMMQDADYSIDLSKFTFEAHRNDAMLAHQNGNKAALG